MLICIICFHLVTIRKVIVLKIHLKREKYTLFGFILYINVLRVIYITTIRNEQHYFSKSFG